MEYKIIFSMKSKEDFVKISNYIRDTLSSPITAKEQSNRILSAIYSLKEFPMRFRLYENNEKKIQGLRVLPVDNYLIFYIPNEENNQVKIIRILYGKRNIENNLK